MKKLESLLSTEEIELRRLECRYNTFEKNYQFSVSYIEDLRHSMTIAYARDDHKEYNELAKALKNVRKEKKFNKRKVGKYNLIVQQQTCRVDNIKEALKELKDLQKSGEEV